MDKKDQAIQKAVEHAKTCQKCSDRYICDEAAQINLEGMIASIFG